MQPLAEACAVAAQWFQFLFKLDQFFAQQQPQRTHGAGVAGTGQGSLIIEYVCLVPFRLNQRQHALQVSHAAGLEQDFAESGGKQRLAIARCQFCGGGNGNAFRRVCPCVSTQRGENLQPARTRHAAIQQQQVESLGTGLRQCRRAIAAGLRLRAKRAESIAQETAAGGVVVRHQYPRMEDGFGVDLQGVGMVGHDEIRVVQLYLAEWRDMRSTSSHLLLCCCLLLAIGWVMPARADVLLTAKSVNVPGARLQQVTVRIGEGAANGLHLQLSATQADVPAMGWRRLGLTLDGGLQRDERLRWIFDGSMHLAGAQGGALSDAHVNIQLSESANTLLVDILQGKTQANTALPLDQLSHAQISLKNLPAGWLQGLLGTVWSGRPTAGRLDAELALDVRDAGLQSSGQFTLNGVGFDTPTGTLAGQGMNGNGRFSLDTTGGPASIDLDASLHGGELLLGPLYAKLPAHSVQLGLHANVQGGAFDLQRLRVSDADALQLDGALAFDAKGELKTLKLDRLHASFPAAYQRYAQAWLNTLGLRDMSIAGELDGSLDLRADGLHSFAFNTDSLNLAEPDGRLGIDGLRGGLDWAVQDERPATTLGWRSLQFYRISNGAAQSQWQSRGGTLGLRQPLEVPVLKGQLRVGELDWRPAAAKGQRLETSLVLTGVDMAAFSHAMGWPAFPGTLGGAIPSLRWVDDRFELQGGLSASLFGGFVDITRLSLQQPFGSSPVLNGDIALNQLDLGAITSVFDFGNMTGRLDGSIDDLRLVNWNPVAFKANLLAGNGGRISQRAVNNLTTVGGGGIAGGLQGAVLKLFKTFGYKRIGLGCMLQGAVCQMSGLEANGDGYTIVEGSGLPRLQVIGHQAQVDWPTLVRRLRDAINGTAPEIH